MNTRYLVTSYLLQHHECALPGIGVFRVSQQPATIDDSAGMLLPAAEEIVFRETKSHNSDGLVAYIAQKESIPIKAAEEQLHSFCRDAEVLIENGKKFMIESFGSLQKNDAGNIFFTREKTPVFFKPVQAEMVYEDEAKTASESYLQPNADFEESGRSHWKIWAVILFALAVVAGYYHFSNRPFAVEEIGNVVKLS